MNRLRGRFSPGESSTHVNDLFWRSLERKIVAAVACFGRPARRVFRIASGDASLFRERAAHTGQLLRYSSRIDVHREHLID